VKQRKKEGGLADADIVKTVWNSVISAVQWSGKNQQQNINSACARSVAPLQLPGLATALSSPVLYPGLASPAPLPTRKRTLCAVHGQQRLLPRGCGALAGAGME